ncbi:MAG: hypothetical protein M1834_007646 [Cirrosporium novae-zelandiae]|nr:MAG: hypothetical protein M1834_007646 [Cirrosporium novae-zelandiae]
MPVDAKDGGYSAKSSKQAACLACKRTKTKCNRDPGASTCKKCQQKGVKCIIPDYHIGRQKGTKNKRSGLAKAVHQIEQAIKKSKANGGELTNEEATLRLQQILYEAQNLLPRPGRAEAESSKCPSPALVLDPTSSESSSHGSPDDDFALDDAENPLQLLAHISTVSALPHQKSQQDESDDETLRSFFGPPRLNLDIGPDLDPVNLGLVTESETDELFTLWGLDPFIHHASFVRSRSAFLFTSILAASALFLPSAGALSRRLFVHCTNLAHYVITNRNRSVEVVLAFMVNIPWLSPGTHWADDETCSYMSMALTIALDLSLDKIIVPSSEGMGRAAMKGIARSDCLDAKKALSLDGFDDVDPASPFGRTLLRRRERAWLALFVLDRGVCLARGRIFMVPLTPLVKNCDNWHISDIADIWDSSVISMAVMRRDFVFLIENVKASCNSYRSATDHGLEVAQSIKDMIENFFNQWHEAWAMTIGEGDGSNVINHPTAPIEVKRFFRAAGLSSALNVMRAAVQGESQLKSMPNNTAIMIGFAACFALRLSTMETTTTSSLAPSVRNLIKETADAIERIGATPSHRKGASALYGRRLRAIIKENFDASSSQESSSQPATAMIPIIQDNVMEEYGQSHQRTQVENDTTVLPQFQPIMFSAMSDYEIIEAINNAEPTFEIPAADFQADVNWNALDWLDWGLPS